MIQLLETLNYLEDTLSYLLKILPKKLGTLRLPLKGLEHVVISFRTVVSETTQQIIISSSDFLSSIKPIPHDSYLSEGTDVLKCVSKLINTHDPRAFLPPVNMGMHNESSRESVAITNSAAVSTNTDALFPYLVDLVGIELARPSVTSGTNTDAITKPLKRSRDEVALALFYDVFSNAYVILPLMGSVLRILSLRVDSHVTSLPDKLVEHCYCLLLTMLSSGVLYKPQAQLCLQALLSVEYRHLHRYSTKKNVFYNLLALEACFNYNQEFVFVRSTFFQTIVCAAARDIYLHAESANACKQADQEANKTVVTAPEDKLMLINYSMCRLFTILLALDRNFPSASKLQPTISSKALATDTIIYEYASSMFMRIQSSIESTDVGCDNFITMGPQHYKQFINALNKTDILDIVRATGMTYGIQHPGGSAVNAARTLLYHSVSSSIARTVSYLFYLRNTHIQGAAPLPLPSILPAIDRSIATSKETHSSTNPNTATTITQLNTLESYILAIIGEFCKILSRQVAALVSLLMELYQVFAKLVAKMTVTRTKTKVLTYRVVSQLLHMLIDTLSIGLSSDSSELYRVSLYLLRKVIIVSLSMPGLFEVIYTILHYFIIIPLQESESANIRAHGLIFVDLLLGMSYAGKDSTYTEKQINLLSFLYNSFVAEHASIDPAQSHNFAGLGAKKPLVINLLDAVTENLSNHAPLSDMSAAITTHRLPSLENLLCKYIDLSQYTDVDIVVRLLSLPHKQEERVIRFTTVADCAAHVLISITRGLKGFLMGSNLTVAQQMMIFTNSSLENHITSLLNNYRHNILATEFSTSSKPQHVIRKMVNCGYVQDSPEDIVQYIISLNLSKKSFGVLLGDSSQTDLLKAFTSVVFKRLQLFLMSTTQSCASLIFTLPENQDDDASGAINKELLSLYTTGGSLDSFFLTSFDAAWAARIERKKPIGILSQVAAQEREQGNNQTPEPETNINKGSDVNEVTAQDRSEVENVFLLALRYYLSFFHIPGESQQIERILKEFSGQFAHLFSILPDHVRKGTTFTTELAYILSYAVLMLNTDLHNSSVKEKMSKAMFIKNTKCADKQNLIQTEFLAELYDNIVVSPFSINEIKLKQFITAHGFSLLYKRLGRSLSIELDCVYHESMHLHDISAVKMDEGNNVLIDICEGDIQKFDMGSELVTAESAPESDGKINDTNVDRQVEKKDDEKTIIHVPSRAQLAVEDVLEQEQTDPAEVDCSPATTIDPAEIGVRTVPLQEIAYKLQQDSFHSTESQKSTNPSGHSSPPASNATSLSVSQLNKMTQLVLHRNSSTGSVTQRDILAFKQYERFIRINIILNMFIDISMQRILAYIRTFWDRLSDFGQAVPELVFHLYRLCDYIIVCQTTHSAAMAHMCDIISRDETVRRICEHRSHLLSFLALSSLFYLRRHVWQANIILPHLLPAEMAVLSTSLPSRASSKEDATFLAFLAGNHAIMVMLLFVLVSSHIDQKAYECVMHTLNLSKIMYVLINETNIKVLYHSFVLTHSDASRDFSAQDYLSSGAMDYFVRPYVQLFAHIEEVLRHLEIHLSVFNAVTLSLSCEIHSLYKPMLDVVAISLLSSERVNNIIAEHYAKELHGYNVVRFPLSIDYLTLVISIFKLRLKDVYKVTSSKHSNTKKGIAKTEAEDETAATGQEPSPQFATTEASIYSPMAYAANTRRRSIDIADCSEVRRLDGILEEFSLIYTSIIVINLYAYMYSFDSVESNNIAIVSIRILAKLIKYLLPALKDTFHLSDNRLCEIFLLPLAHLSKLAVYPAVLSNLFATVSDVLAVAKNVDDYESIFSVTLASLYRIANKDHTMCIANSSDELSCDKCLHDSQKCLFDFSFLSFCPALTTQEPLLRDQLFSSSIVQDQSIYGSYSYAFGAQKKKASSKASILSCISSTASIASTLSMSVPYLNEYDWTSTYDHLDKLLNFLQSKVASLTNSNAGSFFTNIAKFSCLGETQISRSALAILRDALKTSLALEPRHTISLFECYPTIVEAATKTGRTLALDNFMHAITTTLLDSNFAQSSSFWRQAFQSSVFPIVRLQFTRNEYDIILFVVHILSTFFSHDTCAHGPIRERDSVSKYLQMLTHESLQHSVTAFISPIEGQKKQSKSINNSTAKKVAPSVNEDNNIVTAFYKLVIQPLRNSRPSIGALNVLFQHIVFPLIKIAPLHQEASSFTTSANFYSPLLDILAAKLDLLTTMARQKTQSAISFTMETIIILKHTLCIILSCPLNSDAFLFLCSILEGPVLNLLSLLVTIYNTAPSLQLSDCTTIEAATGLVFLMGHVLVSDYTVDNYESLCISAYMFSSEYSEHVSNVISLVQKGVLHCISLLDVLAKHESSLTDGPIAQYHRVVQELFSTLTGFLTAEGAAKRVCKLVFKNVISLMLHNNLSTRKALIAYLTAYDDSFAEI